MVSPVEEQPDSFDNLLPRIEALEAWMATGRREYQMREADKFLETVTARAIVYLVFEQGKLAYFYQSGRSVPVMFGYHRVTKEEAFADWPEYMQAAFPSEIELMEGKGYTAEVRAFLQTNPDLGCMLDGVDRDCASDPNLIEGAFEILGLQGDPVWEFLKAEAVQVAAFEQKLREKQAEKENPSGILRKFAAFVSKKCRMQSQATQVAGVDTSMPASSAANKVSALDPDILDASFRVLGLQGDPAWEFLKAQAIEQAAVEQKAADPTSPVPTSSANNHDEDT